MTLNSTQTKLLDNTLDSLDRLFDDTTTVRDVHAIIFATSVAMSGTALHELLTSTADDLLSILRSAYPNSNLSRTNALAVTETLRKRVAELVPFSN